jgi:phosphatidate cytidylyltransferase
MSPQAKFYWLISILFFLLIIATVITRLLKIRAQSETAIALIDNLNARIKAWWVMLGIFGLAFLIGKIATIIMFAFVSFFALREFITLTPTKSSDYQALSIAFFVLLPVQYYLISIHWYGLFSIFIPIYGFLLMPTLCILGEDTENFLERISKIQWANMTAIYCISHVPAILLLEIPNYKGQNSLLLFYLLLVVQMSDVLQYVFGKIFGKTKIAPIISPSKTVEGFVGGGLGAILIGVGMWWITPFSPLQAMAMSSVIVLMGFLGGLVMSAVKRSLRVKDWGKMIEGHGGMMDRMDSVSFAAPIFFHFTRYFFS